MTSAAFIKGGGGDNSSHRGGGTLKIVHLTPSVAPAMGGPTTVATHLAAAQASQGHQVTIISNLNPQDRPGYDAATAAIAGYRSVCTLISPWLTQARSRFGSRLLPLYHSLFPNADVVHIHGVWEPMLISAAATARRYGVPYIVRPCGMLDPWSLRQRAWKKKLAMRLMTRKMLDGAAFIHVLSEDESRLIEPLNLQAPHAVIANGVNLDEIDSVSGTEKLFATFPALRSHPYVLFLGRLHHKKGLDVLAEAFSKIAMEFPDVHLLVAGPDGGVKGDFSDEILRRGLDTRVHLSGALLGDIKFAAFRHATCFCLPSRQEGFSLSIIEALASRVPVAISTECHFAEVAARGAGRIFELRGDAAADALRHLLRASTFERTGMGKAGRSLVEQELTWTNIAQKTVELYRRCRQDRPAEIEQTQAAISLGNVQPA